MSNDRWHHNFFFAFLANDLLDYPKAGIRKFLKLLFRRNEQSLSKIYDIGHQKKSFRNCFLEEGF